jgi:hypothetical protein
MATGRITTSQGIGCGEGREAGRLRAAQIATELNLMGAVFRAEGEWQAADMARERGPPFLLATRVSPDRLAGGRLEQAESGESLPFCPSSGSCGVLALVWARFGVRDPAARHLPPMSRARPRRFGTCTGEATGRRGLGPSSPF